VSEIRAIRLRPALLRNRFAAVVVIVPGFFVLFALVSVA
jgi:hypothetical protein